MPYLYFIGNPTSCNGKALKLWPYLEKALLTKDWKYSIHWSKYAGHTRLLVQEAIEVQPDIIVALGGDGTVHEVIDEYYKHRLTLTAIITSFPLGTGNDWAHFWKIPHTPDSWIRMIDQGKIYDHDLGHVEYIGFDGKKESSVFNNVAGMAYDAFVADFVESKKKKSKVNSVIYLFYIFRCLFMYRLQWSKIKYDDKELENKFYTINVGVCPYSGGGLQIVPHARPDIGKLALTAVKPLTKWGVLLFSKEFYSGKLHLHSKAISAHAEKISIEPKTPDEEIKLEAEGELLGKLPATFTLLPRAIKICAP